ncbi:GDSL lipase/esterase [Dillenia turbinata]|uniref:GDSL lipase/esterase n=1 Tax=Dillenia turbinata TaxID=194707 RepID=A0AAN8Z3W7_9MAGN
MRNLRAILIISLMILNYYVFVESGDLSTAPALYLFGDSLLDGGNNNYLPTVARVNYPPYGTHFPQGSTGRFTNGKTVGDFIAESLGLPYPPAYLGPRERGVLTGLNYASGACGVFENTGKRLGLCLTLDDQVSLFNKTIEEELKGKFKTEKELSDYLANSLLVMYTGNNDFLHYVRANYSKSAGIPKDHQQFSDVLLHHFYNEFQKLYSLGARKMAIFEIGPLGCIPTVIKRYGTSEGCVEDINRMVTYFNGELEIMLSNLTSTLQDSSFVLNPAYSSVYDAIKNPTKYGLTDSTKPCCITWGNMTSTCVPLLPPCHDYQKHFFWDSLHPTEAANFLASKHFKKSTFSSLHLV